MESLRGGRLILCVTQVDAASGLIEVLETFGNYLTLYFEARLAMVGPLADARPTKSACGAQSKTRASNIGFSPRGIVSIPALAGFYRSADLFVCNRTALSTGQSLIDAMVFDLPRVPRGRRKRVHARVDGSGRWCL